MGCTGSVKAQFVLLLLRKEQKPQAQQQQSGSGRLGVSLAARKEKKLLEFGRSKKKIPRDRNSTSTATHPSKARRRCRYLTGKTESIQERSGPPGCQDLCLCRLGESGQRTRASRGGLATPLRSGEGRDEDAVGGVDSPAPPGEARIFSWSCGEKREFSRVPPQLSKWINYPPKLFKTEQIASEVIWDCGLLQ